MTSHDIDRVKSRHRGCAFNLGSASFFLVRSKLPLHNYSTVLQAFLAGLCLVLVLVSIIKYHKQRITYCVGFSLSCEDFGRMFDHSFLAYAFFFFFFFIKWRLARAHLFHSLGQDRSTVAQQAETTVAECSLTKLRVSSFPDRFPRYFWTAAWSPHSDFVGSRVYA